MSDRYKFSFHQTSNKYRISNKSIFILEINDKTGILTDVRKNLPS